MHTIEFIQESNNLYEFIIHGSEGVVDTLSIYAPNYATALHRANLYAKGIL